MRVVWKDTNPKVKKPAVKKETSKKNAKTA